MGVFLKIHQFIEQLDTNGIPEARKSVLLPLIEYVQSKISEGSKVNLNFICTHNSRRSHLSQIWAQTAAAFYGIDNLSCYSGGTEATALFPTVITTLERSGFEIQKLSDGKNPVYAIKYSDRDHPIIGFSKTYDDPFNPLDKFAAIMTCSQADGGCPFIAGADTRIPITYEDPKLFDNTEEAGLKYEERSRQIALEMAYVFSNIKK